MREIQLEEGTNSEDVGEGDEGRYGRVKRRGAHVARSGGAEPQEAAHRQAHLTE
jgi:hypothetical protein